MVSSPRIAILGDINIDVLLPIEAYPEAGGEAIAPQILTSLGGSAANTAVVLARLGCQVNLIGRVGNDVWGEIALTALASSGVDLAAIQRDEQAATGMMFMLVTPDGERTMFGHRGANVRTDPVLITEHLLRGCDWLHLSGYALLEAPQRQAARRAVELARGLNLPVSLDTAYLPALVVPQEISSLLPGLKLCILGRSEARVITGENDIEKAINALSAAGVGLIGLKLGAHGCLVSDGQHSWEVPPFPAQAVDTTGAGDAFSAGMIFGLLNRLSLPACGILGNAGGSLAVRVLGAGTVLPDKAEFRRLLMELIKTLDTPYSRWTAEALRVL